MSTTSRIIPLPSFTGSFSVDTAELTNDQPRYYKVTVSDEVEQNFILDIDNSVFLPISSENIVINFADYPVRVNGDLYVAVETQDNDDNTVVVPFNVTTQTFVTSLSVLSYSLGMNIDGIIFTQDANDASTYYLIDIPNETITPKILSDDTGTLSGYNVVGRYILPNNKFLLQLERNSFTWLAGSGTPGGGVGSFDNRYLDTTNGNTYTKVVSGWRFQARVADPIYYAGTGVPSDSIGNDNDFYLDTVGKKLYQKNVGTWTLYTEYAEPSAWFAGSAIPLSGLGSDDDRYLLTPNGSIYTKQSGAWVLTSPQDPIGVWTAGTTVPSNGSGSNGDNYLRTTTGQPYFKSGGVWSPGYTVTGWPGAGLIRNKISGLYDFETEIFTPLEIGSYAPVDWTIDQNISGNRKYAFGIFSNGFQGNLQHVGRWNLETNTFSEITLSEEWDTTNSFQFQSIDNTGDHIFANVRNGDLATILKTALDLSDIDAIIAQQATDWYPENLPEGYNIDDATVSFDYRGSYAFYQFSTNLVAITYDSFDDEIGGRPRATYLRLHLLGYF